MLQSTNFSSMFFFFRSLWRRVTLLRACKQIRTTCCLSLIFCLPCYRLTRQNILFVNVLKKKIRIHFLSIRKRFAPRMHSPLEANRTGSLRMVKVIASTRASRRLLSSSPAQTDRLRFCSSTGKTFYSLLSSSFLFFSSLLLPRPALRLYELLLCLLRVPRVFVSSKEL